MTTPGLSGYLSQWERARDEGRDLSAEDLCGDRPDLVEPLRQCLAALRRVREIGTGETQAPVGQGEPQLPMGVSPPGYEVLAELGRGGMGVVYKARQVALGRVVALKMILSGGHAGEEDRRRFLAEAEAIARVRHPGIVQVYDFGLHEGRPFFSLEHCDGGSLADRLNGTPLPPDESARLVDQLARAVEAAHAAGIVHRDLKPANVLLATSVRARSVSGGSVARPVADAPGSDFAPKITDFGLAKRIEGGGATQTGAVLGTPSYMAPEQAEGKKGVGPAADVYALGAILYECLTGRPPFKAATVMDTVLQVISDEPVSPGSLNASVPRDLETICLKCLQKEPARRYPSAQSLADDLGRWRRGEPIVARPVGWFERSAKWVRRNRAVSALGAAVVGVTLAGLGLTTGLYLHSSRLAEDRGEALAEVQLAKEAVEQERNAARQAEEKTRKALDETEAVLVEGLLRPIGRNPPPHLDPAEKEALRKLAEMNSDKLRLRFLDAGLANPDAAMRLALKTEAVLAALGGVNQRTRHQLGPVVARRMRQPGLSADQRRACAKYLVALRLGDEEATREIVDWFCHETKRGAADVLAERTGLLAALDGASPQTRRGYVTQVVQAILAAMAASRESELLFEAGRNLAALERKMTDAEARESARAVVNAIKTAQDGSALGTLGIALQELAGRLPEEQAREAAKAVLAALITADGGSGWPLGQALQLLADRLEEAQTQEVALRILQLLEKRSEEVVWVGPGRALPALLKKLPEAQAREYADRAAQAAVAALAKTDNGFNLSAIAQTLAEMRSYLRHEQGRANFDRAAQVVVGAMAKARDGEAHYQMAEALRWLTGGLTESQAHSHARRAVQLLFLALAKPGDAKTESRLWDAVQALARSLPQEQSREASQTALAALEKARNPGGMRSQAYTLWMLGEKLDGGQARAQADRACVILLSALTRYGDDQSRESLVAPMALLVGRLTEDRAGEVVQSLLPVLAATSSDDLRRSIASTFSQLAGRLKDPQASEAARVILAASQNTVDTSVLSLLVQALASLGDRLSISQAQDAATAVLAGMGRTANADDHIRLAAVASSLAGKITDAQAQEVVQTVLASLPRISDRWTLPSYERAMAPLLAKVNEQLRRDCEDALTCGGVHARDRTTDAGMRDSIDLHLTYLPTLSLLTALKTPHTPATTAAVLDVLSRRLRRPFRDVTEAAAFAERNLLPVQPGR